MKSIITTSAARTRVYDGEGNLLSPFAVLSLTEQEAALVWWALYLAYGNEYRAAELWGKFREAVGEDRVENIAEAGCEVGRNKNPAHPWDELT